MTILLFYCLHARQGYYAFQDYAVQHSWDHFEHSRDMNGTTEPATSQAAMESAGAFLQSYSVSASLPESEEVLPEVHTRPLQPMGWRPPTYIPAYLLPTSVPT